MFYSDAAIVMQGTYNHLMQPFYIVASFHLRHPSNDTVLPR